MPVNNLTVKKYANYVATITVTQTNGDALNLATYSVESELRKSYEAANAVTFAVGRTDANNSNGIVTFSLTNAQTSNLTVGKYVYDIVITNDGTGSKTRISEGKAIIIPGVTR